MIDYTFCCSLPENMLPLTPTSNSITEKSIHFFQFTFISVHTQLFASMGIPLCQRTAINIILLYIRGNKVSITQGISLALIFCVNEFQVGVNGSIFSGNHQQKVYCTSCDGPWGGLGLSCETRPPSHPGCYFTVDLCLVINLYHLRTFL